MVRFLCGFLSIGLLVLPLASKGAEIALNEVYYHDQRETQWIEIYNSGPEPIDVSGWTFSRHISLVEGEYFVIPGGSVLSPERFLLICADVEALKGKFDIPDGVDVLEYGSTAQNLVMETDGDDIYLLDPEGAEADAVWYGDGGDRGSSQSAPLVDFGHSLGRFPDGHGTGVPSADFNDYRDPTPGGPNPPRASIDKSTWGKIKAMYSAKRR